jgi:transcriptional regulator of arginine metabolism
MTKQERHFAIREIIASLPIANQEELRRQLTRRGCRVTQATLSRDLKDLSVAWVASPGGGRYALQPAGEVRALRPLVGAEVLGFRANENLIVIQTLPGAASTVAEFIDVSRDGDIIGTIAGDNTVLVVPRTVRKIRTVERRLKQTLIEGLRP